MKDIKFESEVRAGVKNLRLDHKRQLLHYARSVLFPSLSPLFIKHKELYSFGFRAVTTNEWNDEFDEERFELRAEMEGDGNGFFINGFENDQWTEDRPKRMTLFPEILGESIFWNEDEQVLIDLEGFVDQFNDYVWRELFGDEFIVHFSRSGIILLIWEDHEWKQL